MKAIIYPKKVDKMATKKDIKRLEKAFDEASKLYFKVRYEYENAEKEYYKARDELIDAIKE
jgi:predicted AlkP superfamily phosphohydrolase/phosphomutase